ncbi:tRNA (adenosine(37)-N6)-threonylcarbamoyltransferase complex dimerization subunit type 1 TsaB [Demequina lutea]|uniref:tRNA threonylcarbamoyladenosine biosynthesis protein TsaB n=1 Tax=Demequina lutea TaxID=431489 RepID=A0A7Z0CJE4_9MICO|nr:tRNA (adenosine(37)-N6)-threonylcarbamoyltransferase complex dimerization subunit type 1 TsaB [Demequina lutea]NYI40665.1 tRNA threonylcarbamoyladenosine biosynthesis protein TsaB [Demequina lutea]
MIVAIDTSSAIAVAITDADATVALGRASVFSPRGHAELLSDLVRQALAEASVTRADITAVVAGTGPAPFTGLRVGLVTARTLALAWKVPAWGVCSLDAIGAEHGDVLAVADARRREVYWARYAGGLRIAGPEVGTPASVLVEEGEMVVGRGAVLYPDAFPGAIDADPDPLWLAKEAVRRRAAGEDLPTEPLYLRRPDVHGA